MIPISQEEIDAFAQAQRNGYSRNPNPFATLRDDIRAHWAEFRPKMFARLENAGKLEQAIETAYQLTNEAAIEMCQEPGVSLLSAFEAVRRDYAFLPSETEQPVLGDEPEDWQAPEWDDDDES